MASHMDQASIKTIVFNDIFRINLELARVRDLAYSYR